MVEIIPAINVSTWEEVVARVKFVESFGKKIGVRTVHLDVTDGTFTKNNFWHRAADLLGLETSLALEVHLMIGTSEHPIEERIEEWLVPQKIMRVIIQVETGRDIHLAIQKCHDAGIGAGVAIGPDSPWTRLAPFLKEVKLAQILGVHPGFSGQTMQEDMVFDALGHLRVNPPAGGLIEVDGGVSLVNAGRLVESGANILVAGSAIFSAPDPEAALRELQTKTTGNKTRKTT